MNPESFLSNFRGSYQFDNDIQKIISNYAPKTGKGDTLGGSTPSDKK